MGLPKDMGGIPSSRQRRTRSSGHEAAAGHRRLASEAWRGRRGSAPLCSLVSHRRQTTHRA
eukprot:15430627-Alexandrium_andersonii.AAC.2